MYKVHSFCTQKNEWVTLPYYVNNNWHICTHYLSHDTGTSHDYGNNIVFPPLYISNIIILLLTLICITVRNIIETMHENYHGTSSVCNGRQPTLV